MSSKENYINNLIKIYDYEFQKNYRKQSMSRSLLKCGLLTCIWQLSFYFEKEGFSGFAHWMKKQSQEEMGHAYAMADYIIKRGGTAIVDKIDVVPMAGVLRWNV